MVDPPPRSPANCLAPKRLGIVFTFADFPFANIAFVFTGLILVPITEMASDLGADSRWFLCRAICERDCEGIIVKRKDSIYSAVGPASWFKVLNPDYSRKEGCRELLDRDSTDFSEETPAVPA
jgi:hypothetical protein